MSKTIFEGLIFDVLETEHSSTFKSQTVKSPNAACIAATPDGIHYFMVEQLRFGIDETIIEFPAGKIDPGETPLEAAHRELREEVGYTCEELVPLGKTYSSPAILSESLYLFYADNLEYIGQNLDEDEELNVIKMTLPEIEEAVMNHTINDSKTIGMLYRLEAYLESIKES